MDWTRITVDEMLDLNDTALIALMNEVVEAIVPAIGAPSPGAAAAIAKFNEKMKTTQELTNGEKFVITRWCMKAKALVEQIVSGAYEAEFPEQKESANDARKPE